MPVDYYQEHILEHARDPLHQGCLESPTHHHVCEHLSCGDVLRLDVRVENDTIVAVAWSGNGCALSTASNSVMSEAVMGMPVPVVMGWQLQDVTDRLGLGTVSPGRVGCVWLFVECLQQALSAEFTRSSENEMKSHHHNAEREAP